MLCQLAPKCHQKQVQPLGVKIEFGTTGNMKLGAKQIISPNFDPHYWNIRLGLVVDLNFISASAS